MCVCSLGFALTILSAHEVYMLVGILDRNSVAFSSCTNMTLLHLSLMCRREEHLYPTLIASNFGSPKKPLNSIETSSLPVNRKSNQLTLKRLVGRFCVYFVLNPLLHTLCNKLKPSHVQAMRNLTYNHPSNSLNLSKVKRKRLNESENEA